VSGQGFGDSPAVARWLENARFTSDPDRDAAVSMLADFCVWRESTPDELVALCLRTTKIGEVAISAKGRTAIDQAIEEFVAGRPDADPVRLGNRIRSFLIHNGVFIQGPVRRARANAAPQDR
jgi:hypothetical protein